MKKASALKRLLCQHSYDALLCDLYADESLLACQRARYVQAIDRYIALYGDTDVEIYSAPGRSEVGGNHTDHQHGRVLAAAVNLDAIAVVGRTDRIIHVVSDALDIAPIDTQDLEKKENEKGTSEALIRGVCKRFQALGYAVSGFQAFITSDVLVGAGLSSSAAFETLIATVVAGVSGVKALDAVAIAQIGRYAENEYFGKPCGLMDQCASSVGGLIHIDFQKPEEPVVEKIDVDFSAFGYCLCVVDTKGNHADLTDEYAAIPAEMGRVADFFGRSVLREVSQEQFYDRLPEVRKACGDRAVIRAIHFFEEEKRVDEEVTALKRGDLAGFTRAVKASGDSSYKFLQNVYANSDVENQSISVGLAVSETALGTQGVCRVHGGGFAGTIQAFVQQTHVQAYKEKIEKVFGQGSCHVLKVRNDGGRKVI